MLPDNKLSSEPVRSAWLYDIGVETTPTLDYKPGGRNIQDPTAGLDYQLWRGRLLNPGTNTSKIVLDARYSPEHQDIAYPFMYQFNFSFDFSMRPMYVFVAKEFVGEEPVDNCYLYWFDNTLGRHDLLFMGSNIKTPKLLIDDPREIESDYYNKADTCLFYVENDNLYVRYLRDRFTIPHELKKNVVPLNRVGMNTNYRLQINLLQQASCKLRNINV